MLDRKHTTRAFLTIGALGLAALTGCSDDDTANDDVVMSKPEVSSLPTSAPSANGDVGPEAARQLCEMIGSEIRDWDDQGAAIARVSFNGTVQNWAARNDGRNDDVIRDKSIVDSITTQTCPDVRQQAIDVLDTDNLAGALVGFGG